MNIYFCNLPKIVWKEHYFRNVIVIIRIMYTYQEILYRRKNDAFEVYQARDERAAKKLTLEALKAV